MGICIVETDQLVIEGLFTTLTNVNFNNETITQLIQRTEAQTQLFDAERARLMSASVSLSCSKAVSAFLPQTPATPVQPVQPAVCSHWLISAKLRIQASKHSRYILFSHSAEQTSLLQNWQIFFHKRSPCVVNTTYLFSVEDSGVIFFEAQKIITTCPSACRFHTAVVQNLFFALSEKNRKLVQKLGHMSKRSTREKLMSYLSEEASRQNTVIILLNMQCTFYQHHNIVNCFSLMENIFSILISAKLRIQASKHSRLCPSVPHERS